MTANEITEKFNLCMKAAYNNDEYQLYNWNEQCSFVDGVYEALLMFCEKDSPALEALIMLKLKTKSGE